MNALIFGHIREIFFSFGRFLCISFGRFFSFLDFDGLFFFDFSLSFDRFFNGLSFSRRFLNRSLGFYFFLDF